MGEWHPGKALSNKPHDGAPRSTIDRCGRPNRQLVMSDENTRRLVPRVPLPSRCHRSYGVMRDSLAPLPTAGNATDK